MPASSCSNRNIAARISALRTTPATAKPRGQLLVLGHYDTVYASGTLARMPFRIAAGRVYGPGVFDMKAGIVQALFALDAHSTLSTSRCRKRIVFLWTSDEEIGSESSRKLLEAEANRSDAVFVLEPSLGPKGLLKTARKGVGEAEIIVHGRASHAGLAPEKGVNAIHELALQIARAKEWNDLRRGISVNAGLIEGGTRPTSSRTCAKAILDLRALRVADMQRIERRLGNCGPFCPGANWRYAADSIALLSSANTAPNSFSGSQLAKQMGFTIGEAPRVAARTAISPPRWGFRLWTASAQSATALTRPANISSRAPCRSAPRFWRRCCFTAKSGPTGF